MAFLFSKNKKKNQKNIRDEFVPVTISQVVQDTSECITVEFDIPGEYTKNVEIQAGQYLTLRTEIDGTVVQRPYSLCTAPHEGAWRVAIKKAENGQFSMFAHDRFVEGYPLEIKGPEGNFTLDLHRKNRKKYVFFAAGSGITPIISLIKAILHEEPDSTMILFYGNKSFSTIIFYEELQRLKNDHENRFQVHYFFTEEKLNDEIYCGRLDVSKCQVLSSKMLLQIGETDEFLLCGPEKMIFDLTDMLKEHGVSKKQIHFELFESAAGNILKHKEPAPHSPGEEMSEVTVTLDGEDHVLQIPYNDQPIIEYVLDAGYPAPFSCLGGVCCSCRAKLLEGEVEMMANFALEEDELEEGYRLTCQSLPRSPKIHLDYDQ
ncbi:MAG TPA: 2Fe-2S iron-sulfur cluster-binding protein [Membranihabitans sp.]|nr:2Fe-2S iron-sulfur cluster-binding protein [Membranihabitans sp.]